MKNALPLLILFTSLNLFANPIVIELGEEHTLKGSTEKIWIENAKILSAASAGSQVILKSLALGATTLRQNNKLLKVVVVPSGSQKTYQDWLKLSQKFIGLQVGFCEDLVCLKGKIYRFEDYKRILKLIEKNESSLYLSLEMSEAIRTQVYTSIEKFFRDNGLTPLKVTFASPWRVSFSSKESGPDYRQALKRIGIWAVENKQKIDIADNIRVEIQVAEVKKDFGQTLGMRWPSQYQAQVIDGQLAGFANNFQGLLNANEAQGNIKLLATPNLLCRSGKEAEFFAGGEFPIKVLSFKHQDIIWKKYGIIMKIKPVVDSAGQMSLQIESEVSSIDPSRSVEGIPAMLTNRVSSHFDLIESKTIALSGLIRNETSTSKEGLPFLSRIPILGSLFSSQDFKENRSELVIFVTPQLMKNEVALEK